MISNGANVTNRVLVPKKDNPHKRDKSIVKKHVTEQSLPRDVAVGYGNAPPLETSGALPKIDESKFGHMKIETNHSEVFSLTLKMKIFA